MTERAWSADQVRELLDRELAHHAQLRTTDLQNAEALRKADQEAVTVKRDADLKALQTALQTVEKQRAEDRETDRAYRASQNEWRGQSKDQAGTYLTRTEFEQAQRNQSGDRAQTSTSVRGTIAIGLTALGLVITLVVIAANTFIGK